MMIGDKELDQLLELVRDNREAAPPVLLELVGRADELENVRHATETDDDVFERVLLEVRERLRNGNLKSLLRSARSKLEREHPEVFARWQHGLRERDSMAGVDAHALRAAGEVVDVRVFPIRPEFVDPTLRAHTEDKLVVKTSGGRSWLTWKSSQPSHATCTYRMKFALQTEQEHLNRLSLSPEELGALRVAEYDGKDEEPWQLLLDAVMPGRGGLLIPGAEPVELVAEPVEAQARIEPQRS